MHTTIGTGKMIYLTIHCLIPTMIQMCRRFRRVMLLFAILLPVTSAGCRRAESLPEEAAKPKALVEVSPVHRETMSDNITLQASSVYLKKNVITAPVAGFISTISIKLGDPVAKGALLFRLVTKEGRALNGQSVLNDTALAQLGKISVNAPSQGIVSTLDKQQGDYVLEGTQLCTIAESRNLGFQLNVPFEYHRFVRSGLACDIVLPDKQHIKGIITAKLASMNAVAQTELFIVKPSGEMFLPEGLIATISIPISVKKDAQTLPKSCILTDEVMQHFWVMKLVNDSTAVKINVTVGLKNNETIEILEPIFASGDRILSKGNYGLADTVLVQHITK